MPADWTLTYPGTSLDFGSIRSGYVFRTAPEISDPERETDDERLPRADGVAFGRDYFGGRTITFELDAVADGEAALRASVGRLAQAWRADRVRSTPGAMATLVARHAGGERLIYGRPRRFATIDTVTPQGVSAVVADFATADDRFYSVTEHSAVVSLVPEPTGGLLAPLASPLTTSVSSRRTTVVDVGGVLGAWPVVTIEGPIADPVVEIGPVTLAFTIGLNYDHRLVIDTRPWARTVLRNGASFAGALTRRSTRLSRAEIPPGRHQFVLRGSSATGTATARLAWRESYPSL